MNAKEFSLSITKAIDVSFKLNLLLSPINTTSLRHSDPFKLLMYRADASYLDLYLTAQQNSDYNFMFNDFSIFQFTLHEEASDNAVVSYSYYKSPFDMVGYESFLEDHRFEKSEEAMLLYQQLASEADILEDKICLRYDLSCSSFKELSHPTSHIHFGFGNDARLSVDKFLTPYIFTMFVITTFYSTESFLTTLEIVLGQKDDCTLLDKSYFTDNERCFLHFT